jgi:hypothetical protein
MLVPLSGEVNVKVIESLPFDFVRMLVAFPLYLRNRNSCEDDFGE